MVDTYEVTIALDSLADEARRACGALIAGERRPSAWAATVADRIPALAALEADNLRMPVVGDSFRTIAAGITLLQRRVDKEVRLEALLLARA